MSTQLRLETRPERLQGCVMPYPCECRRCRPLTSRGTGTIKGRILDLLSDGRQMTAAAIALTLAEGADTVSRELRKLLVDVPSLRRVNRGGRARTVWFMVRRG